MDNPIKMDHLGGFTTPICGNIQMHTTRTFKSGCKMFLLQGVTENHPLGFNIGIPLEGAY